MFGRSARQGDPGTVEAIVCIEDELFTSFTPMLAKAYSHWVKRGWAHG
jgi:preprotein translocase subunit SecA